MTELNAKEIYEKLGAPFSDEELEWKPQQVIEGRDGNPPKALVVPYVQSRAIMNRLDEVVGWDRWENLIQELPGGGIVQGIRIWLSDTRSITKWDGADRTNFEPTKGGISSAFKRAAVLFNIGRSIYSMSPRWVNITPNKTTQDDEYVSDKKKKITGYFTPPITQGANRNKHKETKQPKQSTSQNQSVPHNQMPEGMYECTFKGVVEKNSHLGPFLEVWFENNGDLACLYAMGEMRNQILSLNLQEGENVAIASRVDDQGNFFINKVVKVAA